MQLSLTVISLISKCPSLFQLNKSANHHLLNISLYEPLIHFNDLRPFLETNPA